MTQNNSSLEEELKAVGLPLTGDINIPEYVKMHGLSESIQKNADKILGEINVVDNVLSVTCIPEHEEKQAYLHCGSLVTHITSRLHEIYSKHQTDIVVFRPHRDSKKAKNRLPGKKRRLEYFRQNLEKAFQKSGGRKQLTKIIGCNEGTIYRWTRTKRLFEHRGDPIKKLARYLKTTVENLFLDPETIDSSKQDSEVSVSEPTINNLNVISNDELKLIDLWDKSFGNKFVYTEDARVFCVKNHLFKEQLHSGLNETRLSRRVGKILRTLVRKIHALQSGKKTDWHFELDRTKMHMRFKLSRLGQTPLRVVEPESSETVRALVVQTKTHEVSVSPKASLKTLVSLIKLAGNQTKLIELLNLVEAYGGSANVKADLNELTLLLNSKESLG